MEIPKNYNIAYSKLTNAVYLGKVDKSGENWLGKKDVTNQFYDCVIKRFDSNPATIKAKGINKKYSVYVLDEEKHKQIIKLIDETIL